MADENTPLLGQQERAEPAPLYYVAPLSAATACLGLGERISSHLDYTLALHEKESFLFHQGRQTDL